MQWRDRKKEWDGWRRHFAIRPILIDDTWHWLERVEYQILEDPWSGALINSARYKEDKVGVNGS